MQKKQRKPRVYIASAMCFRNSEDKTYEGMICWLKDMGWEVLDPRFLTDENLIKEAKSASPGIPQEEAWRQVNPVIFENNIAAIESSDVVLAILNGMESDGGANFEVGYAAAKGIHLEVLRDDFRSAGDNPGCVINIMPQCATEKSGGAISRHITDVLSRMLNLQLIISEKIQAA